MMTFGSKTLIRESEWMRVFKIQNENTYVYESKFLVDKFHVSPSVIRDRWRELTLDERVEFASAFSAQPPRDDDDQQILEFLMDAGPEGVWRAIAKLLPSHPQPDRALKFLLERIRQASGPRANYYQALELLHRSEPVQTLRRQYDEYRTQMAGKVAEGQALEFWTEYLQCSKSLWGLTHDPIYRIALKDGLTAAPPELRSFIALLLRDVEGT
jgi:hypothetical protein